MSDYNDDPRTPYEVAADHNAEKLLQQLEQSEVAVEAEKALPLAGVEVPESENQTEGGMDG